MCRTIKERACFPAPPATIYRLLADAREHRAFTGRTAKIEPRVGGRFSLDGGRVTGINVDLSPGKRIVQAWREREFPPGIYSMAAFVLKSTPQGGTEVTLTHRGVPKELIPRIIAEWRTGYWARLREYLSHP